jgi:cytochrome c peroxidase
MKISRPQLSLFVCLPLAGCAGYAGGDSEQPGTSSAGTTQQTSLAYIASNPVSQDGSAGLGQFPDPTGVSANYTTAGSIDVNNEFFQSLGTNGRACVSCHAPESGFTLTPDRLQRLFDQCEHNPPATLATRCAVFRPVDGSNSPNADVSTTDARRNAYSMLLKKGLIRIPATPPTPSEFDIVSVDDPYGYADATHLSLFRRPLPTTNLKFNVAIMWDARESSTLDQSLLFTDPNGVPRIAGDFLATFTPDCALPFPNAICNFPVPPTDVLARQADHATLGHAEASAPLSDAVKTSIVNFELALSSAQVVSRGVGSLSAAGANGGPIPLSTEPVAYLENFLFLTPFTSIVFSTYDGWAQSEVEQRRSIARGQALFNTRTAPGITEEFGFDPTQTTCSECHSSFEAGSNSFAGTTHIPHVADARFRTADLPLYTVQCNAYGASRHECNLGDTMQVTDLGRGATTGRYGDVGTFKVPVLRNLAARAPYFHNGQAATLSDVIDHYKTTMGFQFTDSEKQDLINFLNAL